MEQTIAEVLDKAADLIEPDGTWTQGSYARDALGEPLSEGSDPRAVCWCAFGAIEKITGEGMEGRKRRAATLALPFNPSWNDRPGRSKNEVIAAMRCAAVDARKRGE